MKTWAKIVIVIILQEYGCLILTPFDAPLSSSFSHMELNNKYAFISRFAVDTRKQISSWKLLFAGNLIN